MPVKEARFSRAKWYFAVCVLLAAGALLWVTLTYTTILKSSETAVVFDVEEPPELTELLAGWKRRLGVSLKRSKLEDRLYQNFMQRRELTLVIVYEAPIDVVEAASEHRFEVSQFARFTCGQWRRFKGSLIPDSSTAYQRSISERLGDALIEVEFEAAVPDSNNYFLSSKMTFWTDALCWPKTHNPL